MARVMNRVRKAETWRPVGTPQLLITEQGSCPHLERGPFLLSWPLPRGPQRETLTSLPRWARSCCVAGMGRRADPAWALSLLRHVSETGASRPGCRHSPACLGGLANSWAGLLPGLAGSSLAQAGQHWEGLGVSPGVPNLQCWAQEWGALACLYEPILCWPSTHPFPAVRCSSLRSDVVTQMPRVPPTRLSLLDPGPGCEQALPGVVHTSG